MDVGHDDRTTIKLAYSLVCIYFLQFTLTTNCLQYTLTSLLKLSISEFGFIIREDFLKPTFLSASLIHSPLLVPTLFLTIGIKALYFSFGLIPKRNDSYRLSRGSLSHSSSLVQWDKLHILKNSNERFLAFIGFEFMEYYRKRFSNVFSFNEP